MIALIAVILSVFLAIVTFVQLLYLESLRLRTRDLPSLQLFKTAMEKRLGMETEDGALSFALIKQLTLLLLGLVVFAGIVDGGGVTVAGFLEALITTWILTVLVAFAVPQLLYRRTAARWALPLIPLFYGVSLAIKPLVVLLNFMHSLVDIAAEQPSGEQPTSAENIEALISAGAEEGLIEEEDRELIQNVVEFGDKVVREVMTPRPNIVAINADAALDHLRQVVINEQYSRIPVYEENIDQIAGFVHVRDMFELDEGERANRRVRELMRPINFVPETKAVNDLMREMQQEGAHMAIVVDEYGNTAGLVTMEDMVEVILGEIRDEHEPGTDVIEDGSGGFILSGNFDLDRLEDMLKFHPEEEVESTTVGGLVTEWLGHVPAKGESVERDGIRVEVLASDELRIKQVRVSKSQVVTQ